jgi:hypothetical protein
MIERPILFDANSVRGLLSGDKTQTRRAIKPQPEPACYDPALTDDGMWEWCADMFPEDVPNGGPRPCPYGNVGDRLWGRETWAQGNPLPDGSQSRRVAYRADGMSGGWAGDGDGGWAFQHHGWIIGEVDDMSRKGIWTGLGDYQGRWKPSIFMPRWASRLHLTIVEIRAQRVQEISAADALAEGVIRWGKGPLAPLYFPTQEMANDGTNLGYYSAVEAYAERWDAINAKPRPRYTRGANGKRFISHYESYPWEYAEVLHTHRGRPWHIEGNPWVWIITFQLDT